MVFAQSRTCSVQQPNRKPKTFKMEYQPNSITLKIQVDKPVDYVWLLWTKAADIERWNIPFDDWHCPKAENDLKPGGNFYFRMEATNGRDGFDHSGTYDKILENRRIEYTVSDGRKSIIEFISDGGTTLVVETFEPEKETPVELQRNFCFSVLKRFKEYAEGDM